MVSCCPVHLPTVGCTKHRRTIAQARHGHFWSRTWQHPKECSCLPRPVSCQLAPWGIRGYSHSRYLSLATFRSESTQGFPSYRTRVQVPSMVCSVLFSLAQPISFVETLGLAAVPGTEPLCSHLCFFFRVSTPQNEH